MTSEDMPAMDGDDTSVETLAVLGGRIEIVIEQASPLWSDMAWSLPAGRVDGPLSEAIGRVAAALLAAAAPHLLEALGERVGEVSLTLADDAAVQTLNRDWRDKDRATNVLSFPAEDLGADDRDAVAEALEALPPDAPLMLGDIAIAAETVLAEAEAQGKLPRAHLLHLVAHGLLHLIGHDHETEEQAAAMEALETTTLAGFDIDDPYTLIDGAPDA
ncbi:hypothetical protein GCM10011505_15060 [Tistrella bauzanensis]|uniref:Endoribonuclease YbeY n=2 Tax=Tistrella bauzanensis TaxID=657419 RepID=A0ABQ1IDM5_9PROT|nr:hypothetical protein GCM10011505_15060 [Tistrella bauzanensis]